MLKDREGSFSGAVTFLADRGSISIDKWHPLLCLQQPFLTATMGGWNESLRRWVDRQDTCDLGRGGEPEPPPLILPADRDLTVQLTRQETKTHGPLLGRVCLGNPTPVLP